MSPEDRELLQVLRRQQADLQRSLARLDAQLSELEIRAHDVPTEASALVSPPALPPLTPHVELPPPLPEQPDTSFPPVPTFLTVPPPPPEQAHTELPPLPAITAESAPEIPRLDDLPPVPKPSLEFQIGRWLTRAGAVFFVLSLIFADSYFQWHKLLGAWGKLGLGATLSMVLLMLGQRIERRNADLIFYARSLMAAGLAGLYVTFYAACSSENLRVIYNPVLAGLLLLSWSGYIFWMAERRQSQTLSLFAVTLAYFSSAINPISSLTMGADLILALTAVVFLVRNGWAALSYFSLAGTYLVLVRRLVTDESGEFIFDSSRMLHFWPYAIYLIGAWLIFTAAVVFTAAPAFRGGKRLAFLSLNNGALAGLLLLAANLAGYGHDLMGWLLLGTGAAFLITSRIVGWAQVEPEKVMAAYAAQGLALVTAGIMVVYTGITRGFLLLFETFFLGLAGHLSRDRILIASTYVAAFFATGFCIWEIGYNAHHPWLLGFGGAVILLANAWWARSEIRLHARETVVVSASYYCTLALGLIFTAMCTELSENVLPPALAFVALGLTFLIYVVEIYELPPIAQTLLLAAQALVLFPMETGQELPWWTTAGVAAVTLIMIIWWTRQTVTRTGAWIDILNFLYALALLGLTYETVRPWVNEQQWMVTASLLSVAFLVWGACTRVWSLAAVGELFLAVAIYHFFVPFHSADGLPVEININQGSGFFTSPITTGNFPWHWWAAVMPLAVTFFTARAVHQWLKLSPEISGENHTSLRAIAHGYQLLALAMVIRWVSARISIPDEITVFLLLSTLMLDYNVRRANAFGVRCSFVLSAFGLYLYLVNLDPDSRVLCTLLNSLAFIALLLQPVLLNRAEKPLVTLVENWTLLLLSVAGGFCFVSFWIETCGSPGYLTLGWALYALFLFLFGLLTGEIRFRWCGLAVLLAAIVRVFVYDFWGLTTGYRVLTFFVLAIIVFSVGYLILRNAGRTKENP